MYPHINAWFCYIPHLNLGLYIFISHMFVIMLNHINELLSEFRKILIMMGLNMAVAVKQCAC